MGELFFFNIAGIQKEFETDTFFETGTGWGFGVQYARIFPFKRILSVEILAGEVEHLRPAFKMDPRVQLFAGSSADVMRQALPQIRGNILFWLDAHYPGVHYGTQNAAEGIDPGTSLPLEQELSLIKQLRPANRDVILIDDLRIYERDKFEWGNLSSLPVSFASGEDSRFLYTMFQETHIASRCLEHSGYLALLPKPLPGNTSPKQV